MRSLSTLTRGKVLTLTPAAVQQIRILTQQSHPTLPHLTPPHTSGDTVDLTMNITHPQTQNTQESKGVLRIGVKKGGCSGMSYQLDMIKEQKQQAAQIEQKRIEGTPNTVPNLGTTLRRAWLEKDEIVEQDVSFGNAAEDPIDKYNSSDQFRKDVRYRMLTNNDIGVKLIVDSKALLTILGSEMDYVQDPLSAGFVFKNPNVKHSCGCGMSFGI